MSSPPVSRAPIRSQDLRVLFRAREIVHLLSTGDLEAAIEVARARLMAEQGRRRYLQEILPAPVVYAIPGPDEVLVAESADRQQFHLQEATLPLHWQIAELERECGTRVVKLIHRNGHGQRVYWL